MADEGTLEALGRNLAFAFEPLVDRLSDGNLEGFFSELGLAPPAAVANAQPVGNAAATIAGAISAMPSAIAALEAAVQSEDAGQIASAGADLLRAVLDAVRGITDLGNAVDQAAGGLSAAERAAVQAFAAELPGRIFDYVIIEFIRRAHSGSLDVLRLIGLVDDQVTLPADSAPLARPARQRRLSPERLLTMLTDPEQYLRDLFQWGEAGFDGSRIFPRIQTLLENYDTPTVLLTEPGSPPVLEAFIARLQADNGNPPGLNIRLRVPAIADFERQYRISSTISFLMSTSARFDAGMGITLRPPLDVSLEPISGDATLDLLAGLEIGREDGAMEIIGQTGGSGLFLESFSGSFGVSGSWSVGSGPQIEPAIRAALNGGRLKIDFSEADGFLKTIAGGVQIDSEFNSGLSWTPSNGVSFEGSSAIEVAIPLHQTLGPLNLQTLYLIGGIGSGGSVTLEMSSGFSVELGPLQAVVDRFGAQVELTFPSDGEGNLGKADLGFKLKLPTAVGMSIDAGAVRGGGFLSIDQDRGEYAGILELSILELVSVTAIAVISTKLPDGEDGFAFVAIISVEFNPGIQLGFGFTLVGVGGIVGLNREADMEAIAQGATSGSVDSVLFPKDVIANAPKIINDIRTFFPPDQGTFLIGPMMKFGWGTPTLISLSVGVIIEIPGAIGIVGKLTIAIPDERVPLIIINVAVLGEIDFDKKHLWFLAVLYESRVIFMPLQGGMGVYASWGSNSQFIISVGGFHPRYDVPVLPFGDIPRLAINILDTPVAKVRVLCYFAVTSNTVQFGARAELYFGISIAKIEGHIAFDALFQFSPFYFVITISASLSVKLFGAGLFSVRFRGELEGPTPWHIEGTGSISVLFWDVDVDFSHTWGEDEDTRLPPISVMPMLVEEFSKDENWTAELANANQLLVTLRPVDATTELVLHPIGSLRITQRAVPLELTLDKIGSQRPDDANRFSVDAVSAGVEKRATVKEQFAIGQFQDLGDGDRLSASDYEQEEAGLDLSVTGNQTATSYATKRVVRYETIIIDSALRQVFLFFEAFTNLFLHLLLGNSAARNVLSAQTQAHKHLYDEKIKVDPNAFVVVNLADNTAVADAPVSFASRAQAREYMAEQGPAFAKQAHIVRPHEMREAA
ncbi:hypothetical protein RA28_14800 [Ruegeria sp. ANG-S4]|uniref:DUF6603 domain-containing protein n=1 Tax=Ruegeria sp. ANG-S4 TaxID=1577904 RepID=UPI00057E081A|nr:DUF6603 domain-containing protein [Ruegeria sp. ANG-S4]KIC44230.1 hypothetical protein RA28_14800 [Ruegeria sp. ANG-S4]